MSSIDCANWNSDKPMRLRDSKTGRPLGVLMPIASQATLEASPGIQGWSHPRGKVATELMETDAVAIFADHWERKWQTTYPLSS